MPGSEQQARRNRLDYLAWAYSTCLHDHTTALSTARTALAPAREIDDQLQAGWALNYAAVALNRLGRTDEGIAHLHQGADCLSRQTGAQSRLAEPSALNSLGRLLRRTGRPDEALTVHRRSEALFRAGIPGKAGADDGHGHGDTDHHTGERRIGRLVGPDECTAGNICFWSERGFRGQKTVYKSALVECTRIVKPSAGDPARLMTARSVKNRTDRTVVIGYNDSLCLIPSSITLSQTPLHLAPLSDNADLGPGIRYIRST
ncbi:MULTISPECIES: tetratricopeptide repeat protein [Streptomyces]|uniref:tetratricopeptide repeat protein n=1 Tax=Streptomyces TaxID=1883 RepID=UPI001CCE951C|nr:MULTISPECIES: tetratricopeptide repeat protein [Streptomyces]UBI40828.1 tetratricopeptide repeat protein [Streptomyces mobaraensis]